MVLAALLIYNQRPFLHTRNRPDAVSSLRQFQVAELQIPLSRQPRRHIGTRAPHFSVRHQAPHNLPPVHRRGVIIHRDLLPRDLQGHTRRRTRISLRESCNREQTAETHHQTSEPEHWQSPPAQSYPEFATANSEKLSAAC